MNKTREPNYKLALIFSVCDEDERHFARFNAELTRLGFEFFVNFDHCGSATKKLFKANPLCSGANENDDAADLFEESHRQKALRLVDERKDFDWMLQMDVDETLERDAPRKIADILMLNVDVVDCRVLDLWGDGSMYRVDGPFAGSHREKFFNLRTAEKLYYYHPTSHAPKHVPRHGRPSAVRSYDLNILHWGMMNMEEVEFHCKRWDAIYTRSVGGNPYGTYPYLRDPNTVIQLQEVPAGVHLQ